MPETCLPSVSMWVTGTRTTAATDGNEFLLFLVLPPLGSVSRISPCLSASTFPFPESEPGDGVEIMKDQRGWDLSIISGTPLLVLRVIWVSQRHRGQNGEDTRAVTTLTLRKSSPTFSQVMLELGVSSDWLCALKQTPVTSFRFSGFCGRSRFAGEQSRKISSELNVKGRSGRSSCHFRSSTW